MEEKIVKFTGHIISIFRAPEVVFGPSVQQPKNSIK